MMIVQVVPSAERIASMASTILAQISGSITNADSIEDVPIQREKMVDAFNALDRSAWATRISSDGTGSDIQAAFDANGYVTLKNLASWWILEDAFDGICQALVQIFGGFTLRERQNNKLRVEVSAVDLQGNRRRLAQMFGAIEARKAELSIQEYSIAQTSLEQIFNQFAAQVRFH